MSVSADRLRVAYGPVAMVTGASDGIGRAFAERLAAAGLDLLLVARRAEVLAALADDLSKRHDISARAVAADLSTPAGVATTLAAVEDVEVGLLVAAAGFGASGDFVDAALDDELEMIDVNCRAVVALAQPLAQRMAARGRGGLVLFGSLVGFQGVARIATYAATKAFVQTFAESLAQELEPRGVHVLAVAPGPVRSGFEARARMTMGLAARPETVAAGALAALGRRRVVRPGWLAKGLEASLAPLPRAWRVRMMSRVMAGMTRRPTDDPAAARDGTQPARRS